SKIKKNALDNNKNVIIILWQLWGRKSIFFHSICRLCKTFLLMGKTTGTEFDSYGDNKLQG
ncbi:hypothetical protein QUF72_13925, partial [Desulfobacterales bacterium HSG2]|nr:hypothetical protein [Desulfobacterales bacterium HSG2]